MASLHFLELLWLLASTCNCADHYKCATLLCPLKMNFCFKKHLRRSFLIKIERVCMGRLTLSSRKRVSFLWNFVPIVFTLSGSLSNVHYVFSLPLETTRRGSCFVKVVTRC